MLSARGGATDVAAAGEGVESRGAAAQALAEFDAAAAAAAAGGSGGDDDGVVRRDNAAVAVGASRVTLLLASPACVSNR